MARKNLGKKQHIPTLCHTLEVSGLLVLVRLTRISNYFDEGRELRPTPCNETDVGLIKYINRSGSLPGAPLRDYTDDDEKYAVSRSINISVIGARSRV